MGGSCVLFNVIQTIDGGYAACGYTSSFGAGSRDFVLFKLDENGEEEWMGTYGTESSETCEAIFQTRDGGYALAGVSRVDNAEGNYWVVKTDAQGEMMWESQYADHYVNRAFDIAELEDGGFLIGGEGGSPRLFFGMDMYIVRTDSTGETLWDVYYGTDNDEVAYGVFPTDDGGYAFAGLGDNRAGNTNHDFLLIKTGPDPVNNYVKLLDPAYPSSVTLHSPYPNPFNSRVKINYTLGTTQDVSVKIFDLSGRLVTILHEGKISLGNHFVTWNAVDAPTGTYICKVAGAGEETSRKLVLVK